MDEHFHQLLKNIRLEARKKNLKEFTFQEIEEKTGIRQDELKKYISNEKELIANLRKFLPFIILKVLMPSIFY